MSVVLSEISPLNCHWVTWEHDLPVCTHPGQERRHVSEAECLVCDHWTAEAPPLARADVGRGHAGSGHSAGTVQDPLNREMCPRCGSHDVALMQRDELVQSFSCSICHQHWLATRPWPAPRDTRSRRGAS